MDITKNQNKQVFCGKESSGNRSVTLQNLLSAGILESGPGAMTIEYLVKHNTNYFVAYCAFSISIC